MAASSRSGQAGVGLGLGVGVGLGDAVGDGFGEGVGLAEGEPQAELTAITNRRMAASLPPFSLSDEFSMVWVST
jgi:hypothetical protein